MLGSSVINNVLRVFFFVLPIRGLFRSNKPRIIVF